MTDHDTPEDEILDRLRAADPAARSRPDLDRLRVAVDARIRDDATAGAAPATARPAGRAGATVTPLTSARSRRSSWLPVAAVAAGALVLGAAGYGLGLRAGSGDSAPTAAPAISLGGPAGGATSPGAPEVMSAPADAAMYPAPSWSHMSFHAVGLSDETGTSPAWTYDPSASFTADRTAALGAALGLEGEPQRVGGSWQLGVTDGSGAYLMLSPDGTTTVSFYDPAKDPHQCPRSEAGTSAPDATGVATDAAPAPYEWCDDNPDAAPPPHGEDALSPVRTLLTAAGYDPATFELAENDYGDPNVTQVVAHQLVDGERTGLAWYVILSAAGVQNVNGMLAPVAALGDVPVVSPTDAVDRLGDPRFGSFGEVRMLAAAENHALDAEGTDGTSADAPVTSGSVSQGPDAAPPTGPPPAGTPGSPVPWPVEEVAITGARLGPALYTTPSGTALLVPAYELSADDGRTWSVIAVAEESLDLAR
ncbi:hypothetical protein ATJ97_2429 [Georgenia soli]|uniref:Uncharacterized protein n=1 Tax=Georgenia soli TaxID=638953 RepID=A0A2A9ENW4_9MICO|nr:hypothetical protein [Georgenia soli]PFG39909.1 hypothetical protein ATJ97_2429 [Georgenia soli]